MTDLHSLLVERRSVRRYTSEPLSPEDVKTILEAGLLAPTSKSSRSWEFVVVDNKEKLEALAQCKPAGAVSLNDCPLAIVVCGDSRKSDPWIEDASIAAAFMQLQAQDLGLGSCWVQVRGRFTAQNIPSEEYVAELLGIPEEINVLCIITVGHKGEERKPQNTERLLWSQVHLQQW